MLKEGLPNKQKVISHTTVVVSAGKENIQQKKLWCHLGKLKGQALKKTHKTFNKDPFNIPL